MRFFTRRPETPQPPATALEASVDRTLAGIGYALIGASLFTVWITGLVAWLIAFTHRKSPDPVARAHFKYQLWVADLAGLAVGVGAALIVSGGVFIVSPFFDGDTPSAGDVGGGVLAAVVGALLFLLAFAGTLVGVGFGVVRLVRGRLVGLRRPPPAATPAAPPAVRSR